jgi:hypothetical protein
MCPPSEPSIIIVECRKIVDHWLLKNQLKVGALIRTCTLPHVNLAPAIHLVLPCRRNGILQPPFVHLPRLSAMIHQLHLLPIRPPVQLQPTLQSRRPLFQCQSRRAHYLSKPSYHSWGISPRASRNTNGAHRSPKHAAERGVRKYRSVGRGVSSQVPKVVPPVQGIPLNTADDLDGLVQKAQQL